MTSPLVCICIPVYNAAATIADTLQSLLIQTYLNIHIHIVDNVSTDNTLDIIKQFSDKRIIIHTYEQHVSGEKNFDRCIQVADGKYTAIYHADDIYNHKIIEKQVQFLESNPSVGGVLTRAKFINEQGLITGESKTFHELGLPNQNVTIFDLISLLKIVLRHYNFLICPSAMVKTELYQTKLKVWRYEQFRTSADLDMWFRIAEEQGLGLIAEPLINYRISRFQFSHDHNRLRTERGDIFKVLDYWIQLNSVKPKLTRLDWQWYEEQNRRDTIQGAAKALLKRDLVLANEKIRSIFSMTSLRFSFSSIRGFQYFLLAILVKLGCYKIFQLNVTKLLSLIYKNRR